MIYSERSTTLAADEPAALTGAVVTVFACALRVPRCGLRNSSPVDEETRGNSTLVPSVVLKPNTSVTP